jgi:hypothetical protein
MRETSRRLFNFCDIICILEVYYCENIFCGLGSLLMAVLGGNTRTGLLLTLNGK